MVTEGTVGEVDRGQLGVSRVTTDTGGGKVAGRGQNTGKDIA